MDITIVTTSEERKEYGNVMNAHAEVVYGNLSKAEFLAKYPRKVWLDTVREDASLSYRFSFIVVDNRDGECFVEDFKTLDGAMLYATDVHTTCERREDWDYMGALKDGGPLIGRVMQ